MKTKLEQYNKKRDFTKTKEPKGKIEKSSSVLRYVIQYHQARAKHYDFRLEYNGVLLSWAVPKGLPVNPKDKRLAVHVEDHPVSYINFEGIIPKGNYGAGSVEIFDSGVYSPLIDMEKGLKKGHLKFVLYGKKFKGGYSLVKTDDKNWLVIKSEDDYVNPPKKPVKNPFSSCEVMLATLTDTIPKKDYIFEIKYDGYRIVSYVENGHVKMLSRNNNDYTKKFKKIADFLKTLDRPMVLDGEVVVFDEKGRSDFSLLQNSIKTQKNNFCYVIFDILALDGEDLRQQELLKRKDILEKVMIKFPDNFIFSSYVKGKGKQTFNLAKKLNLEGIMAKKVDSTYTGSRGDDWLKIKCYKRQEFVVAGIKTSQKNKLLSALLLGYYKNKKLIYVGKVGTGFNETQKKDLSKNLKPLAIKSCPFCENINETNVTWLKPITVAEIKYSEITKDGHLRQPSFIEIRQDKNANDVVLEKKK